jgi:hypothetical protein
VASDIEGGRHRRRHDRGSQIDGADIEGAHADGAAVPEQ